jgi:hypothetical protein
MFKIKCQSPQKLCFYLVKRLFWKGTVLVHNYSTNSSLLNYNRTSCFMFIWRTAKCDPNHSNDSHKLDHT